MKLLSQIDRYTYKLQKLSRVIETVMLKILPSSPVAATLVVPCPGDWISYVFQDLDDLCWEFPAEDTNYCMSHYSITYYYFDGTSCRNVFKIKTSKECRSGLASECN